MDYVLVKRTPQADGSGTASAGHGVVKWCRLIKVWQVGVLVSDG